MKLFFKALCCAFTLCCIISMTGFYGACYDISDEVFRLHVIANSDSEKDQELKLKVRDAVSEYSAKMFNGCENKEQAMNCAKENIQTITNIAQETIRANGYEYPVQVYVTKMSFNTRVYEKFTLPAGEYDALRIVIGSGKGKNWWCVLYPSLCFSSAEKDDFDGVMNDEEQNIVTDSSRYEIKFRIVEIFEGLFSLFR